ncbi:MAG TPA: alpha/beta hydrolase-fold protein [Leifsonia sp.]|nr:alpha/beta hydrolase-fold protein [Leifsonia sp.]
MFDALLATDIVDGPVIVVFTVLAAVAAVVLLVRRPTGRWLVTSGIALAIGLAIAVSLWLVTVRLLNLWGGSLGLGNYLWVTATCGGVCLAIVNLWRSRVWRKVVAAVSIPVFLITGTLAVNASYGINHSLGNLIDVSTEKPIHLTPHPAAAGYDAHLWKHWKPPADLPAKGRVGTQVIPNTRSGFRSRPAGIYLPPAALVKHPPRLPLVVLLMGQPGNPDPLQAAVVLDKFAAAHHGLAPIVIVPDQLGDPLQDPLCLDTYKYGKAETFLTKDVVTWADAHLNIAHDHRFWTIAGYSNGGQCALSIAVKHPHMFSNLIDVSGEEFPGAEHAGAIVKEVFGGNASAYEAQKPLEIMKAHRYPGMTAVFTAGDDDPVYRLVAAKAALLARSCGMTVDHFEIHGGGHGQKALTDGLEEGFRVLYPVLGLANLS